MNHDSLTINGKSLTRVDGPAILYRDILLALVFDVSQPNVARMLDTILVTLMDHGPTPSSIAARLTLLGAPESIQGAVASGLLSAGSRYLGTVENVARMLRTWMLADGDFAVRTRKLVEDAVATRWVIPGFGHPIHTDEDPRVTVLQRIQTDLEIPTRYMEFMRYIGELLREIKVHTFHSMPRGRLARYCATWICPRSLDAVWRWWRDVLWFVTRTGGDRGAHGSTHLGQSRAFQYEYGPTTQAPNVRRSDYSPYNVTMTITRSCVISVPSPIEKCTLT